MHLTMVTRRATVIGRDIPTAIVASTGGHTIAEAAGITGAAVDIIAAVTAVRPATAGAMDAVNAA